MARTEPRVRASRALVVAAAALMIIGFVGLGHSVVRLSGEAPPVPSTELLPGNASASVREASAAYRQTMEQTIADTPHRRVLEVANFLLSGLLIIASVQLLLLRRRAVWWVTQAVVGNIAWTLVFAAAHIHQLLGEAPLLRSKLAALSEAMRADPQVSGGELPVDGLYLAIGARAAVAAVAVLAYAIIGWRLRRSDVDAVLEEAEQTRRQR